MYEIWEQSCTRLHRNLFCLQISFRNKYILRMPVLFPEDSNDLIGRLTLLKRQPSYRLRHYLVCKLILTRLPCPHFLPNHNHIHKFSPSPPIPCGPTFPLQLLFWSLNSPVRPLSPSQLLLLSTKPPSFFSLLSGRGRLTTSSAAERIPS